MTATGPTLRSSVTCNFLNEQLRAQYRAEEDPRRGRLHPLTHSDRDNDEHSPSNDKDSTGDSGGGSALVTASHAPDKPALPSQTSTPVPATGASAGWSADPPNDTIKDANVCAFDHRGVFLAIGTIHGEIFIMGFVGIRRVIRTLIIPATAGELLNPTTSPIAPTPADTPSASVSTSGAEQYDKEASEQLGEPSIRGKKGSKPAWQSIISLGWSQTSRLLFVGTVSGLILVWDVESGEVVRVVRCPNGVMPRFIRPNPLFSWLVLLITWEGMPYLLDIYSGRTFQVWEG